MHYCAKTIAHQWVGGIDCPHCENENPTDTYIVPIKRRRDNTEKAIRKNALRLIKIIRKITKDESFRGLPFFRGGLFELEGLSHDLGYQKTEYQLNRIILDYMYSEQENFAFIAKTSADYERAQSEGKVEKWSL